MFGLWVGVMSLFLLFTLTASSVYADPSSGDDSGEVETVGDIYDASTALTAYVNNVVGANGNDKHNNQRVEDPGSVGNAGAYVGYGDEKQKFVSFITSNTTVGSSSSTYDAWEEIIDGGNQNAAYAYVRLGKTLADAGLDETLPADTNLNFVRIVTGVISLLVFSAGEIVPFAFNIALGILKALNVFAWFGSATGAVTNSWKDAFPDAPDVLSPIVEFFGGLYDKMLSLGIFAVAILLALVLMNILLLRKNSGHQFMTFVKRVVFMFAGLPLCATLYTAVLDDMYNITREGTASAKLVAASFVDFEGWANEGLDMTGLNIASSPKGTDGAINDGGTASKETLQDLRNTALKINAKGVGFNHSFVAWAASGFGNSDHDLISGNLWNSDGSIAYQETATDKTAVNSIYNMLVRYLSSDMYTSSTWASQLRNTTFKDANMGSADPDGDNKSTVRSMFEATDEVSDWMRRETQDNLKIWNGESEPDMEWTDDSFNIFKNGDMQVSEGHGKSDQVMKWTGRLSDLSMYNYLSTTFDDSSIITYSGSNSVSEHVKQAHASVTAIGNGILGFLLMLNMWVCIGITALIGVYFALSMVLKNLKTSFQLIASVPMAMMGAVKSIAQVISYLVMMIVQLVVGAFMYSFLAEFLVVFATVFENLVRFNNPDGGTEVTIISSFLATIGVQPDVISGSGVLISLVVVAELVLLLVTGFVMWHYRRMGVRVYSKAWYYALKLVTVKEFQETFEYVWRQKRVRQTELRWIPSGAKGVFTLLRSDIEKERGCMTHA